MKLSESQQRALQLLRQGHVVTKGKGFASTLHSLERLGLIVKHRGRWLLIDRTERTS